MRQVAPVGRAGAVGSGSGSVADSRGDVGRLVEERGGGFEVAPLAVHRGEHGAEAPFDPGAVLVVTSAAGCVFVSGYRVNGGDHASPHSMKAQPAAVPKAARRRIVSASQIMIGTPCVGSGRAPRGRSGCPGRRRDVRGCRAAG